MTLKKQPPKVDFDEYAEAYEKILQEQLGSFSSDRSYFSEYKANIIKSQVFEGKVRILDFGAGVGLMIPHLLASFPNGTVYASDISTISLSRLSDRFPSVVALSDEELNNHQFDVIVVATVLHHIALPLRSDVMKRLAKLLAPGGLIFVFEHNPYNPVTRRLVATCPFDEDAILLPMKETFELIGNSAGLEISDRGYTLFFPPRFRWLLSLEGYLRWLPLGGQYFVCGKKSVG